jgi:hypothetical protein
MHLLIHTLITHHYEATSCSCCRCCHCCQCCSILQTDVYQTGISGCVVKYLPPRHSSGSWSCCSLHCPCPCTCFPLPH